MLGNNNSVVDSSENRASLGHSLDNTDSRQTEDIAAPENSTSNSILGAQGNRSTDPAYELDEDAIPAPGNSVQSGNVTETPLIDSLSPLPSIPLPYPPLPANLSQNIATTPTNISGRERQTTSDSYQIPNRPREGSQNDSSGQNQVGPDPSRRSESPVQRTPTSYPGSRLNPAYDAESHSHRPRPPRANSYPTAPSPALVNAGWPPNPYSGMGLYATPQMYASPLGMPYTLPPPVDYSHIYAPNGQLSSFQRNRSPWIPHSPLPPPPSVFSPFIPPLDSDTPPVFRPIIPPVMMDSDPPRPRIMTSADVVVAAATPERKRSRSFPDPAPLPDPGSFSQSNPYRLRSHSKADKHASDFIYYPEAPVIPPTGTQQLPYDYRPGSPSSRDYYRPSARQRRRSTSPIPGPPPEFQPYYSSEHHDLPPVIPDFSYEHDPTPSRRRMTSADVVTAAVMTPVPERRETGSFAEHNPYRLRTPRREAPIIPPGPADESWYETAPYEEGPARRRPSRRDSYPEDSYGVYGRRADEGYGWTSGIQRPAYSYRPSSPDHYTRPSRRRYRRTASPYRRHHAPARVHSAGSPSSDYLAPPTYYDPQKPSVWSRVGSFFKSPFEGGRPATFQAPYPRSANEPTHSIVAIIIGQIYFHVLLRLPSLYFSRVSRIFDEANLNLYEMAEMVFETAAGSDNKDTTKVAMNLQVSQLVPPKIRPQYERLKISWESFIDSLMREWETFNIVSVMLLTAILTILQISTAASDPVTRYAALFSLICALISLLFGCMYIIRFGTMRKTYAAVEWAKAVVGSSESVIWNVWVLLAMPAVWLTWSILLFIAAIMSFVWRATPDGNVTPTNLSDGALLAIRIVMSAVLGLGVLNGGLITGTFRDYGEALDKDWRTWIDDWQKLKAVEARSTNHPYALPLGGQVPYLPYGFSPYLDPATMSNPLGPSQTPNVPPSNQPYQTPLPVHIYIESDTESSSEKASPVRRSRRRSAPDAHSQTPGPASPGNNRPNRPTENGTRRSGNSRSDNQEIPVPPGIVSPTPRILSTTTQLTDSPPPTPRMAELRNDRRVTDLTAADSASPNEDDNWGDPYPNYRDPDTRENRVRFRSPLASAQETASFGGSDWGRDDIPPTSAAGALAGSSSVSVTHQESIDLQSQNTDSLRRRRPG
ncbi:hypothetical protein BDZ97DRAFT_1915174 [Flammula alnicola]|nr:hypothetical protein BDZ97DRAFT_1915174 [Flammula alnicola]